MKLYCLSGDPNRPCFILKFKQTTIMLDCSLDVTTLLNFLPLTITNSDKFSKLPGWSPRDTPGGIKLNDELKEIESKIFVNSEPDFGIPELSVIDMAEVDAILLSNFHNILALPYITEFTDFQGVIYATEPTMHLGRQYMEELVEYIERSPKTGRAYKWKQPSILSFLPSPLKDVISPNTWRKIYTKQHILDAISNIHPVAFNVKQDIFGSLTVMAISSGYCIGSSNWVIQSDYEKISYVTGTSTLTTHPKPMDQSVLKSSDILIMCSLTQTPTCNPDAMIGDFCINTAVTLRNGGNVLVPVYPSGVTYDLFECLSSHLESCGLVNVPMYFISPVAKSSLAYSNIYAEWLSAGKQSKVYLPEQPFPHAELVNSNRLKHFPNLHDGFTNEMKTPCVVFTGHPSLRLGDAVHFLQLWGKSATNTLIFTEPDFPYLEALSPYQPLAMKVCYCPIDTSLSFAQANKLIRELKPEHLVIAKQYTKPPLTSPHSSELTIDFDPPPLTYLRGEVLTMPVRRKYERIEMDPKLAQSLMPVEVRTGVAITTINAELATNDNQYVLKGINEESESDGAPPAKKHKPEKAGGKNPNFYTWGSLDTQEFIQLLNKQGISDVKVESSSSGGQIIHLLSEDALIQIDDESTHIICEGNELLRIQLRDTLVKCLAKF